MPHHLAGHGDQPHLVPRMPWLAPSLLPTLPAQALRLAPESIARGWLGAVVAVLRQPPFQLPHALQEHLHLFAQGGILGSKGSDLYLWGHATSLSDRVTPS